MKLADHFCLLAIAGSILAASSKAADSQRGPREAESARLFEAHVAPILARRCFECHDSTSREGRLDLSRKETAVAERKNGQTIVPGDASASLLWQAVESNEMPDDRPPLSEEEKQRLREWIDSGAVWAADQIDPLALTRDTRAAYSWMRRLTVPEYIETVRCAVGVNIGAEARRLLPPDVRADGFHNTAYNLTPDLKHIEAYASLAAVIVTRMDLPAFAQRFADCASTDDECLQKAITRMGKWLFRAPIESSERKALLRLACIVREDGGDFTECLRYVVEAMLQSPRFLYRIEDQTGNGKPRPANPYELASRLSYLLWGAPPDEALLRAADSGELTQTAALEKQVARMLEDPRAIARSARFLHEWLDLDRLANLRPDPKRFPNWRAELAGDMRHETIAFFKEVAWKQERPLSDLLNAEVSFLTPRLAEFYGLDLPPTAERIRTSNRNKKGLLVLYRFDEEEGDAVRDRSKAAGTMDLKIEKSDAIEWVETGLKIEKAAALAHEGSTKTLVNALKKSIALTLEAWITPADNKQKGPARILTLSANPSERNFTLGQDGDKFEVRLRTSSTDRNGMPALASAAGAARPRVTHVVYTRDHKGRAKLYVDGTESTAQLVQGDFSNWKDDFKLLLGNEDGGERPWRGTLHRVAIYNRALSAEEVRAVSQSPVRYDLAKVPNRGGLLTQASLLTVGGEEASMVARGLFVLQDFLFSRVGNPPPCADTTPVPSKPGLTQRAIAETRIQNNACGGCHVKFEPLSFALEKFNGLGAYREKDEFGNPLREDGEITFPGEEHPVKYRTAAEFMDLLAASERVRKNFTRKVTQFAIGRPLVESDAAAIDKIHAAAQKGGGTYASLITAVAMSDLVRNVQTETETQNGKDS